MNLGINKIKSIYVGSTPATQVYVGNVKVWHEEQPVAGPWLCFTAEEANSTVHLDKYGSPNAISLETSTDGTTWTDYSWTDATGDTLTLANIGDKVYMRAKTNNQTIASSGSNYYKFVMTGKIAASGNIQTLLKADGSRTDAPNYCYVHMFSGCTSLTQAPALPATTFGGFGSYNNMFKGCTSLTTAPALPATTLAVNCYQYMFSECSSLTSAPVLPATTLASNCYSYMFSGCTSLTSAPVLPATTLAKGCYNHMLDGCTSLTTAPELPATTLAQDCYKYMFKDCSSLTHAPILPADITVSGSYDSMFQGCGNLSYVEVSLTSWGPAYSTNYWLYKVAASGTFKCPAALGDDSTITRGASNCPNGWTVVNT